MSKVEDREIAEIFSRISAGKCSEEDLTRFSTLVMEGSSLGDSINEIPNYFLVSYDDNDLNGKFQYGAYYWGSNIVNLNKNLVTLLNQKKEGVLARTVDMLGHETTHYKQFLNNERESKDTIGVFTASTIEEMYDFLGVEMNKETAEILKYYQYRNLSVEVDARKGGRIFSREVLSKLKDNKYLDKESKKYVQKEIDINEKAMKKDMEVEAAEVAMAKKFFDSFSNIPLSRLEELASSREKDSKHALDGIVRARRVAFGDLKVCQDYYEVLDQDMPHVKDSLSNEIGSFNFPKEMKDKMQKKCMDIIENCDTYQEVDPSFNKILTADQIYGVCKGIVKRGEFDKFRSDFFRDPIYNDRSGELANRLGRLIVDESKRLEEKVDSVDKARGVASVSRYIAFYEEKLDESVKEEIMGMSDKMYDKAKRLMSAGVRKI